MKILYLIPALFLFGCAPDPEPVSMSSADIVRASTECWAAGLRAVTLTNYRNGVAVTVIQCRPWPETLYEWN